MKSSADIPPHTDLSAAAVAALRHLAKLNDADRIAVLRCHGVTIGPPLRPRLSGTALPTLRQLVPNHDRVIFYNSPAWAANYRPRCFLLLYMLGCTALAALGTLLGASIVKCGTTMIENAERRWARLNSGGYGAYHRGSTNYEHASGFDNYALPTRFQMTSQHSLSPVRLSPDGIVVGLPSGLSGNRFEAAVNRKLDPLRLHAVADSEFGRDLCARIGLDPARLHRFTKIGKRYSIATELTLLRPQADCNALAQLAADIIIDATMGVLPSRGSGDRIS